MRVGSIAVAFTLLAEGACFSPSLDASLSCEQSNLCPAGFRCIAGDCIRAGGSVPDASPAADGASGLSCADWDPAPRYLTPCDANVRFANNLALTGSTPYVFDTGTGELSRGATTVSIETTAIEVGGVDVIALTTRNFFLASGASLRVVGPNPLMIAALGNATIDGTIDLTSVEGEGGAGANTGSCIAATAGSGGLQGGSGGGGGGLGSAGGNGGGTLGAAAGLGGAATIDQRLRGGCAGGAGGNPNSTPSRGGAGGGALHIAAALDLSVAGSIHAGGEGGSGGAIGQVSFAAGGGGGSGGHIGLEAKRLVVLGSAIVAANGGGGGGASGDDEAGRPGAPGALGTEAALGGEGGRVGGDGASVVSDAAGGDNGVPGSPAAGGGGGGTGLIFVGPGIIDSDATFSPTFVQP